MQQVELAAAQYVLSTYSSPCFSVKIVYNYGLWQNKQLLRLRPLPTDSEVLYTLFNAHMQPAWARQEMFSHYGEDITYQGVRCCS